MGFANVQELAVSEGRISTWRKTPTQTTATGIWFDLSMSPGNPVPNYYIGTPNAFTPLRQSTDGGLFHAGAVSPKTKHLRKLMVMTNTVTAVPLPMILMDYIGFYGFLDESVSGQQFVDNTNALPRYADGAGVQMMAVVVAGQTGGQTFTVQYTNQDGVSGRVSGTCLMNTQATNGTLITTNSSGANAVGPFIPLQAGDSGVRYVESITFGGTGDIGLIALVLVKPLANIQLRGINAPTEVDYFQHFAVAPRIIDDAFLSFICLPSGTLSAAPIHGTIECVWN